MGNTITYLYKNKKVSDTAVKHAFNLLSIYTGIKFIEDNVAPQIVYNGNIAIPDFDPIEAIIDRISLRGSLGLAQNNKLIDDQTGLYLSGIVGKFVDTLVEKEFIVKPAKPINLWPENYRFACAVTHDVDIIRRSVLGSFKLCFKSDPPGGIRGFIDSLKNAMGNVDNPYDKFEQWIEIEKNLDIKSTFFVFDGKREHRFDPKYKTNDIFNSLNSIQKAGNEIALHSGIKRSDGSNLPSLKDANENVINNKISGIRPHYLSAALPDYWQKASEAGFSYSSCLGYDESIGYFSKIDLPFIPFDLEADKPIKIVEIPITLMDGGLFGGRYDNPVTAANDLIEKVSNNGGLLVLDWHQRVLYERDYPGWGDAFKQIIEAVKNKSGVFIRMDEIAKLFNPITQGN